ncbi:MAG: 30S ribosomal protein S17 [Mycoplasmataceae bacterium]|nr:30S ribosomal protein S17 [Mycoplasmataceae bacterium]
MAETIKKAPVKKAAPKKAVVKKAPVKAAPKKAAVKKTVKKTVKSKKTVERKTSRKVLVGQVVSVKGTKTIAVAVESYIKHRLYSKRFISTKKFAAHDEKEEAKLGDKVEITETRPISKTKRFRLSKIVSSQKDGE